MITGRLDERRASRAIASAKRRFTRSYDSQDFQASPSNSGCSGACVMPCCRNHKSEFETSL
ncbi:hypothetical protein D3C80_2087010 [compost metagenome]